MGYIISDGIIYSGGGGSGGSGGHTILDNDGVALAQQDNLQFKGAYSDNNATDGVTEVNIVRSMTKAEYDQLSAEERVGIINITDVTSGRTDRFQPVIYSEEEREIGVSYDGKPLYAITLVTTQNASLTNNSWTTLTFSNQPADVDVLLWLSFTGAGTYPNFYEQMRVTYDNEIPGFKAAAQSNMTYKAGSHMYIEYTKTTDTPGSGQWTPQGVPAVHYSTDEQVVGTWIDGSTIYEKTFDLGSETSISYNSWYNTGLTGLNKICDCFGLNNTGASYPLNASIQSDTLHLWGCRGTEVSIVRYLTIRYTKSSS